MLQSWICQTRKTNVTSAIIRDNGMSPAEPIHSHEANQIFLVQCIHIAFCQTEKCQSNAIEISGTPKLYNMFNKMLWSARSQAYA